MYVINKLETSWRVRTTNERGTTQKINDFPYSTSTLELSVNTFTFTNGELVLSFDYDEILIPILDNASELYQELLSWRSPVIKFFDGEPADFDDKVYQKNGELYYSGSAIGSGGGGSGLTPGTVEGSTLRWNGSDWAENLDYIWETTSNYKGGLASTLVPGQVLNGAFYLDPGVDILFAGVQDTGSIKTAALSWNGPTTDDNSFLGVVDDSRILLSANNGSGYQGGLIFNPNTNNSVWVVSKQTDAVELGIELNKAEDKILINLNDNGAGNYTNGIEISTSALGLTYRDESALTFSQSQVNLEGDNPNVLSRLRFSNQNIVGGGVELYWGNVIGDQDQFYLQYSNDHKTYFVQLQDNISTGFTGFTNIDIQNGEIISNISTKDGVSGTNQKSELYLDRSSAQLNYENQQGGNDYLTRFNAGQKFAQMSFNDNNSGDNSLVVVGTDYTGDNSVNLVAVNNSNQCSVSVSNNNVVIIAQDGTDQITITVRGSKNAGGAMLNITGDIPNYADNTAALAAGCVPGDIYRSNNNSLRVVV